MILIGVRCLLYYIFQRVVVKHCMNVMSGPRALFLSLGISNTVWGLFQALCQPWGERPLGVLSIKVWRGSLSDQSVARGWLMLSHNSSPSRQQVNEAGN